MGIFGAAPFETEIEKATNEKNTTDPWALIMDICDKVSAYPRNAKDCLKAILKRLAHSDPHVVIQALTLLDACVNNCGKSFHLEVASREFETEYKKLLLKAQPAVMQKMLQQIKKWAENDFKTDPQLNLIPSFYQKLREEGHNFSLADTKQSQKQTAAQAAALKDPNVVSSQQEEDDIAKAIELSLKEVKNSPKKQTTGNSSSSGVVTSTASSYPSLYPSFTAPSASAIQEPEPRKVRALYDFEAAEENELTFKAGDIILVTDDTDPNWWKGSNDRGDGLFPSNFVTADLSFEPEREQQQLLTSTKKTVQFEDEKGEKSDLLSDDLANLKLDVANEINEEKIDRLLHLLHEANPEDPSQDTEEMLRLEQEVNQMGPLIDCELERVDRKHAQLTQLSSDLVDAVNLYHTLMREPERNLAAGYAAPLQMGLNYVGVPSMNYGMSQSSQLYGAQNLYNPASQSLQTGAGPHSLPLMMHQIQTSMPGQIPVQYQNGGNNHQHSQVTHSQYGPSMLQQQQSSQPNNNFQIQQNGQFQQHHNQQQQQQQQQQHQFQASSSFQQPNNNEQIHQQTHFQHINGPVTNPMAGIPSQFIQQQQQHSQLHSLPPMNMNLGMMMGLPHPNQFAQLNQPVTQTILGGQNDSKTNIPIYQQQRNPSQREEKY